MALSESQIESRRAAQKRYKERNAEKLRAAALARYYAKHEANKTVQRERARAIRKRGAIRWRLAEPRSVRAAAKSLRWRSSMRSSNGDYGGSVWDQVMVYGNGRVIRSQERGARVDASQGPGAVWLRKKALI